MRTNDSVITWLNKQLTNAKIRDPGFRMAPPPKNISHVLGDQSTQAMTTRVYGAREPLRLGRARATATRASS